MSEVEIEEGAMTPEDTTAPSKTISPNTDYSWVSYLDGMKSENVDKVLEVIKKDISLKEKAMEYEMLLDQKSIDDEKELKHKKIDIEKIQFDREDFFNRWGLILSFAVVVFSLIVGGVLMSSGSIEKIYGGGIIVTIGAGLGSGAISKIAEKLMGKIFKFLDR